MSPAAAPLPLPSFRRADSLIDALHDALPQTQCTRCGFADCRSYATAMASGEADVNQCPPGGGQGIVALARLTGRPARALDPAHGTEGPRRRAVIDEAGCIGCTLCLKACPVDCIVGGPKHMHTVIEALCTGCELCIPACPVDCIAMTTTGDLRTGWDAWSPAQAAQARDRHAVHRERLERDARDEATRLGAHTDEVTRSAAVARHGDPAMPDQRHGSDTAADRPGVVHAALARARAARAAS